MSGWARGSGASRGTSGSLEGEREGGRERGKIMEGVIMLEAYLRIYHVAMETAGGISLIYTSSKFNMIYNI